MTNVEELKKAVEDLQARLREEVRLRTELERRCHVLEKLAHRDPVTGLRTENYLRTRVHEEVQRSIRYPSATTLVTLCASKDRRATLSQLGARLAQEMRSSDHVFGLGDCGMAILLLETPEEGARRLLERVAEVVEQFLGSYGLSVTSFPVDTNLADEFFELAMERHNGVVREYYPEAPQVRMPHHSVH